MIFNGDSKEFLTLQELNDFNKDIIYKSGDTDMTLLWNNGQDMNIIIDKVEYNLGRNEVVFLTEFHKVDSLNLESVRFIRWNQPFFCPINHDNEVGSKGLLFFGANGVPIVKIIDNEIKFLENYWENFSYEMSSSDSLQKDMLQSILKQILIFCARSLKKSDNYANLEKSQVDIIREFNFLVEGHFSKHHDVAFYASKLNKSPKTLSNLFAMVSNRPPISIIHDRIMLHARRQINYTNLSIKEIAYDLGYEDIQTFSRFFKNREGISPMQYREKLKLN
ncbi:helix-turn-helix domain-containing protein [Flavobacterium psychroterrae]|uniref:Helix-turn-helix domain-containing protein n=1 Tax=Flavobacterium psychroterrae TaxID=2133767 RepID=A0ABS5PFZ4_9FLAO|nr:helix-turn-helix domain-containing protein [Flavobacterium psychroterrae]MBS7232611.1 helix-turn-helix domain-containing protein [Flavobacterium psychroterrae]